MRSSGAGGARWEPPLLDAVLAAATNTASSAHGRDHWERVAANGARLAAETAGADPRIVSLFALLHDAMRRSDGADPSHPRLAANLARRLRPLLELDDGEAATLDEAIRLHDCGQTSANPTIGCCWDADRLDLPRVGITPRRRYLSTYAAIRLAEKPRPAHPPSRQFFHGGRRGLRIGDCVWPPKATGNDQTPRRQGAWSEVIGATPECADAAWRERDRVYFSVSRREAYLYAALTPGGGALYLVTPIGEVTRDLAPGLDGVYTAPRARVNAVLDPEVPEVGIDVVLRAASTGSSHRGGFLRSSRGGLFRLTG